MLRKKSLVAIYCCMLLVVNVAFPQNHLDSARAHALFEKGVSLEKSKQYAKAMKYYRQATTFFLENEKWEEYIRSQSGLSWMHYLLDNYDSASYLLNNVLIIAKDKGNLTNIYVRLGRTYSSQDKHHEAIEIFKKGATTCDLSNEQGKHGLSDCYNQLSVEFWHLSQYDSTIFYQMKNMSTLKLLLQPNYTKMGNCYGNMGLAYWKKGQLHLALEYYLESHRYFDMSNNDFNVGVSYSNLGGVNIELHNFPVAISYFKKAMPYLGKNRYVSGILYHNIGECFTNMKQYDSALHYANKALMVKADFFGKSHSALASTYAILGTIYTNSKQYQQAATYYKKALQISKENLVPNDPNLITFYNLMSQHYVERGQYRKALSFADTAISMNYLDHTNLNDNSLSNMKSKREYLQSLSIRAAIYEQTENPKLSISTYEDINNYYDSIVFTANLITEKHFYKEGSRTTSNALMERYAKSLDQINQKKTFNLSEKNKSAILRLSLDEDALKNSIANDEVIRAESKLKSDLAINQSQLLGEVKKEKKDQKKINDLQRKIFKLNRDQENFKKDLEQKYPQYFNLKYSTKTVSIEEIQDKLLKENQALIEYFLGDSSIYLFAVTTSGFEVKQVEKDALFNQQLNAFRKRLHHPNLLNHSLDNYKTYVSSAHKLYNYLIAPVKSLIQGKDLIIVPDGELALIPYEALLTHQVNNKEIDYQSLPYLIKEHAISYANSATLLFNEMQNTETVRETTNGEILAFAPEFENSLMAYNTPADTVRSTLGPLSWTNEEVNNLSSYFNAQVYLDSEATEKNFIQEAGKYRIIHIASHGLVDDENPMYSKIAFTYDEQDSLNDGYLHTFELYNTQLNAEMAVLSACNTGYGKVLKGEGVLNLARGFFYAGCKSVVMSLWVANDRSTATLMGDFYEYLADDHPKNIALRNAKLEYLNNNDGLKAHPYYWSQFVISGNIDPILNSSNLTKTLFLYLGGLFLLSMLFYFVRKKRPVARLKA